MAKSSSASNRDGLMPSTPAVSTIIVFPYHIQKLIKEIIPLVDHFVSKNRNGSDQIPLLTKNWLIGPFGKLEVGPTFNGLANFKTIFVGNDGSLFDTYTFRAL